MTHEIVFSPEAQTQIEDLYDYIADRRSSTIAIRFTDAILHFISGLRDFPQRGTMRDDVLPGLRTLGFRRRVTVAFVVEPAEVVVVGVFYGGQDFEALLRDG